MTHGLMKIVMAGAVAMAFAAPAVAADVKTLREESLEALNGAPAVHKLIEGSKFARSFRQQPPMVPHVVAKYQIDLKNNECLKCHDWQNAAKEKAPEMTEAHYKDRDGNVLDRVSGQRWFCVQCHAPQTDAQPLVDNTFTSAGR